MTNKWTDRRTWIGLGSTMGIMLLIMSPAFFSVNRSNIFLSILSSIGGSALIFGLPFLILFRKLSLGNSIFFTWCIGIFCGIFIIINDNFIYPKIENIILKIVFILLNPALPGILAFGFRNRVHKVEEQKRLATQTHTSVPDSEDIKPSSPSHLPQSGYSNCPACGSTVSDQAVKCWACNIRIREI